jgi:hypothetical protein
LIALNVREAGTLCDDPLNLGSKTDYAYRAIAAGGGANSNLLRSPFRDSKSNSLQFILISPI